ncbi:iron ABC transporter permease [Nocardioides humilatus]|uniref:Iron ABC transporter permease n=1 Tax=Nocardioides humilatus TaxID=2607660 RepID=A0A5B1LQZ0_9ACTN|nr:iron ABC transporter permease [Nocardioides humilatus]
MSVAALAATLAVVVIGSLLIGSTVASPSALFDPSHVDHAVLVKRWERTLLGLAVGAAFALAGACMQGLTRNPLADPGLLGVNAGAAFAMATAIAYLGAHSLGQFIWYGFAGAAAAAVVVHLVASVGRDGATPAKLTIAGAALTAGLSSWTTGVLLLDREAVEQIRRWQVGTVAGRDSDVLMTVALPLALGAVLALAMAGALNTLALGDDLARGLGRRTAVDRVVVGLAIVLLAGTGTAVAGPIAFIGLVVPHVVRRLVGGDYKRILPFSAGYGGALVVAADTVGRVVLPPAEVQVGVMATVIGVPVLIWVVSRGRRAGL